ncbi:helix-turn-helix domain-containing protein [Pseudoxanthomonas suwonensis]
MVDFTVQQLLKTPLVEVRDVVCAGLCRHQGEVEQATRTQLVFPYRGTYLRHVGGGEVVADASQVLFFNAGEPYRISHPHAGGDASLAITPDPVLLREIAPPPLLHEGEPLRFRVQRLRIDPRAQVLVALLRHSLREGVADALEGESLALTLMLRAIGPRTTHAAGASHGRQRLVDRARLVLMRDLARRWTLAEVAAEVGVSPVYLTQSFHAVEGVPLYRYQLRLRLRLARALDLLGEGEEVGDLAHQLGFSSHSHFSAAFHQAYGRTPASSASWPCSGARRQVAKDSDNARPRWRRLLCPPVPGGEPRHRHEREDLCGLRLRTRRGRDPGEDRRPHRRGVLRRMRREAEEAYASASEA